MKSENLMLYREVVPPDEIAHLVLSFWEFAVKNKNSAPIVHEIFPDGCISLIYRRNKNLEINALSINGLNLETIKTTVFAGDIFWGMRFSPAACAAVLRRDPAEIKPKVITNADNFGHLSAGLLKKLTAGKNLEEAIEIYEAQLKKLQIEGIEIDEKIAESLKIIEKNPGEIKISEVAKAAGLSVRQLERRFRKSAGLSPKQYVRARRIRATAVALVEKGEVNWAHRAAEMGFADQAHLTHEFSSLTGRAPKSFAEKVKRIEHGNLIK